MNFEAIGRLIISLALFLLFVGLVFLALGRAGITRLPGDILFRRGHTAIFFPIVTSIIVSLVLTGLFNFIFYLLRR